MENAESKKSGSHIAANIITWIVPAAAFVAGMLVMGIVPDSFSMISFVFAIGLGLMLTRIIFIIRARRPSSYKTWRLILWFFLLAFFGFVFLFLPKDTHRCSAADAQSKFEAVVSKKYPDVYNLPLSIGSPSSVEYHTYSSFAVMFESRSYTLLCSYDEEEFYEAAEVIDFEYVTHAELFHTIGDYNFYLVTTGNEQLPFFKESAYIIINDVTHEIGFMYFDDIDLDVADDRTNFLNHYCGWEYIR